MNIRLGIYEIFSRIVPGGLYLVALAQFFSVTELFPLDWSVVNNLSLIPSLGLAIAAYLLGGTLDKLTILWLRLFRRSGVNAKVLQTFKQAYQDHWHIHLENHERGLLLAYIRTKHLEIANDIDRQIALSIMLRNVSLGLMLLTANQIIEFFTTFAPVYLLLGLLLGAASALIAYDATRFRVWSYESIYNTILAYRLNLEDRIQPVALKTPLPKERNESPD